MKKFSGVRTFITYAIIRFPDVEVERYGSDAYIIIYHNGVEVERAELTRESTEDDIVEELTQRGVYEDESLR